MIKKRCGSYHNTPMPFSSAWLFLSLQKTPQPSDIWDGHDGLTQLEDASGEHHQYDFLIIIFTYSKIEVSQWNMEIFMVFSFGTLNHCGMWSKRYMNAWSQCLSCSRPLIRELLNKIVIFKHFKRFILAFKIVFPVGTHTVLIKLW